MTFTYIYRDRYRYIEILNHYYDQITTRMLGIALVVEDANHGQRLAFRYPASSRMKISEKDKDKLYRSTSAVEVKKLSPRVVVAIGIRGSYSEDRFRKNEKKLLSWIAKNEKYEASGNAYAVYWNGPLMPGFLKRSEVHMPIRKKCRKTETKNIGKSK